MRKRKIRERKRYYCAVEGEGEQSFIKFLQHLSNLNELHVYLDCEPLGGGGYKSMLEKTIRYRSRNDRRSVKHTILLVDSDRAEKDDGWTIETLSNAASKNNIIVCLQNPNQEGLLVRMIGNEQQQTDASNATRKLIRAWPNYQKPVNAHSLISKFSLDDLIRVAKVDSDLKILLTTIGFKIEN